MHMWPRLTYQSHVLMRLPMRMQLREREQQLRCVSANLLQLQHDFQHNLLLLDGRDAELNQYDAEAAALVAEVRAKALAAEEMRAVAAHARAGGAGCGQEWHAQRCSLQHCRLQGDVQVVKHS